jgi:hypothetical protein
MNTYLFIDKDGYVSYTVSSEIEQPNGILLDFEIPEQPSSEYKFNYNTRQWVKVVDENQAIIQVNIKRSKLLFSSDWTQIPNNPLTAEQQSAWATYRQELRDIPQQSGYPFNVIWPTSPQG